jgi:hypothetical protein
MTLALAANQASKLGSLKSISRKNWSKEEERELFNLIRPYYPGVIPLDKILQYAEKHGRTEFAVKSKIQKIKQGHQASLESELDKLFLKGKALPEPKQMLPTPNLTPIKNRNSSEPFEMKEYLKDFLKTQAINGIESSDLRQKVPKHLIDSENLARIVGEFEKERKIRVQNLPALLLDSNTLQSFDAEAIDAIRLALKKRYRTGIVEGYYPLDILFEDHPHLKERFIRTEMNRILTMTFIFWVD